MHLESYNENRYLFLLKQLKNGLSNVESCISISISTESYNQLEMLIEIYTKIFKDVNLKKYFDFSISKAHKVIYFKEVEYNRSNSYYHLKLIIQSEELLWLDKLYDGVLSRIIKYYKALFSKIDNLYANSNPKQKELNQKLLSAAKNEIDKLNAITSEKNDINSEKKRLKDQYLSKIPFQALFHITHKNNIPGILEKGILSHTKAHIGHFCKEDISNPEINKKRSRFENINNRSIHDYAPLYINPKNPMLESLCNKQNKREDLILIKISPNILVNSLVLFTDGNAAEESSNFYNSLEDFNKLNWVLLSDDYYLNQNDGKRIKCSEVLVQDNISIPYIEELLSFNENNFEDIFNKFPNHMGINLRVDKNIFY